MRTRRCRQCTARTWTVAHLPSTRHDRLQNALREVRVAVVDEVVATIGTSEEATKLKKRLAISVKRLVRNKNSPRRKARGVFV